MALSLSVLETYIDGEIEMMRRADKKQKIINDPKNQKGCGGSFDLSDAFSGKNTWTLTP